MRSVWKDGERSRVVELEAKGADHWRVRVDDAVIELSAETLPNGDLRLATADGVTIAEVTAAGARRFVHLSGMDFVLDREASGRRRAGAHSGSLEAPMPGLVTRVLISPGDDVKQGQPLVAIEAMKMEHVLRAPRDGRVRAVAVRAGEMVSGGVALVEMEEE
jgi:3-methylcrotonyl-CoA carboxylase alpha subunit